jgi:hypothetical protein
MRYEQKDYDCVEIWIGGDCADNCTFAFVVGAEGADFDHGVEAIGVTEMGVMITHNGSIKMFEGLPYQARFAPREDNNSAGS